MRIPLILLSSMMGLLLLPLAADEGLYGPTARKDYLQGKFQAHAHPDFVRPLDIGIPARERVYLRKEAAHSLLRLYQAFRRDHPSLPFSIRSGFRSFYDQKWIWENKYRKRQGDCEIRVRDILRYSSMPGTSRHHWGTDFDLHDLTVNYYQSGQGLTIYNWMKEHAEEFGFCQPYTPGRSAGYEQEPWHWSYIPLAGPMRRHWNSYVGESETKGFLGQQCASRLSPVYVNSISSACTR